MSGRLVALLHFLMHVASMLTSKAATMHNKHLFGVLLYLLMNWLANLNIISNDTIPTETRVL
jgi:hypothetical protein